MDATTTLLTALNAKIDRVLAQNGQLLAQNHELVRQSQRTATPVDLVDTDEAVRRSGASKKVLYVLAARGVFTDGRPPEKRTAQCPRRWYVDECVVYRTEGEAGVRRLRETFGRE